MLNGDECKCYLLLIPDRAKTLTTIIAIVACLPFVPLAAEAQQAEKV